MKKVLVLSDNQFMLEAAKIIFDKRKDLAAHYEIRFACSRSNISLFKVFKDSGWVIPVNVKEEAARLASEYTLIFSMHCKQLFPPDLVARVRCINIHPGLNPNNRGWYPQVFSILNGKPCGATIHEMDRELDHGAMIAQRGVEIHKWDTSLSLYNRIQQVELELFEENLDSLLSGDYTKVSLPDGNLNLKKDFEALRHLDLNNKDSFGNHLDRLRALTHPPFRNAYFVDESGRKIFVRIELTPEEPAE